MNYQRLFIEVEIATLQIETKEKLKPHKMIQQSSNKWAYMGYLL